jgi:acyl-CoA dehydrogenase
MGFPLPEHLARLLAEMHADIEREIALPQAAKSEDALDEMRRRPDKAGWPRYRLPASLGSRDGTNPDTAVIGDPP